MLNNREVTKGGRVRRLPLRVFHLASILDSESIQEQGLLPKEGVLYACPNIEDCLEFIEKGVYTVWEISTEDTLPSQWYVNDAFYKDNKVLVRSFAYLGGKIHPYQIKQLCSVRKP